jgi:hypothetical protein
VRAAATASFSPAEARVTQGAQSTVGVVVMGVQDLTAVELVIGYDPRLVEATDIRAGSLLTLDGQAVAVDRSLESGRVRVRFTRPAGTAGSGVVASVTFRGLAAGASPLRVESLTLTSGGASATVPVIPGRITVTQ